MIWCLGFVFACTWIVLSVIMLMCLARCKPLIISIEDIIGLVTMTALAPFFFLFVGVCTMWDEAA